MKNIKIKFISKFPLGLLIGILGTSLIFSTFATASFPIKLIINNQEITCDSPPQMINGRVMVPVSNVAKAFNANASWDAQNNTIRIDSTKAQESNITTTTQQINTNTPTQKTEQGTVNNSNPTTTVKNPITNKIEVNKSESEKTSKDKDLEEFLNATPPNIPDHK